MISILKLEIECEFITPLIMHGVNKKKLQLRSSSIKGLLRYWWRTINGSKKDEEKYFGGVNQISPFKLYLIDLKSNDKRTSLNLFKCSKESIFLLNGKRKSYLGKFKFGVEFNRGIDNEKEYVLEFFKALKFLMLFGGLGNRSRKTCGNFIIKEIKVLIDTENIFNKKGNSILVDRENIMKTGYYTYNEVEDTFKKEVDTQENDSKKKNRIELLRFSEDEGENKVIFDFRKLNKKLNYVDIIKKLNSKYIYKPSSKNYINKKNVVNLMKFKSGYKAYVVRINDEV